jgi:hypothetical protein
MSAYIFDLTGSYRAAFFNGVGRAAVRRCGLPVIDRRNGGIMMNSISRRYRRTVGRGVGSRPNEAA